MAIDFPTWYSHDLPHVYGRARPFLICRYQHLYEVRFDLLKFFLLLTSPCPLVSFVQKVSDALSFCKQDAQRIYLVDSPCPERFSLPCNGLGYWVATGADVSEFTQEKLFFIHISEKFT